MEIWFYQLTGTTLGKALTQILDKALQRGWRVVVQSVDDLRVKALDEALWTTEATSFLPHATAGTEAAAGLPIVVTGDGGNPNAAQMRVFVEGAEIDLASGAAYERVILVFDGTNEAELEAARKQWSRLKATGADLSYWRQKDGGGWERQNASR